MATKKTRKRATHVPAAPANRPTLRFTDEEITTLQADMASVGGIPVSLGKYAHHATMSYAKLRKLENEVRDHGCLIDPDLMGQLLKRAGL
jgi:hypothetical protein